MVLVVSQVLQTAIGLVRGGGQMPVTLMRWSPGALYQTHATTRNDIIHLTVMNTTVLEVRRRSRWTHDMAIIRHLRKLRDQEGQILCQTSDNKSLQLGLHNTKVKVTCHMILAIMMSTSSTGRSRTPRRADVTVAFLGIPTSDIDLEVMHMTCLSSYQYNMQQLNIHHRGPPQFSPITIISKKQ